MNLVILKGNIGKEPVFKTVGENQVLEFSLATRGYKNTTDWHNITAWGKLAETGSKYLERGSPVVVQGRIQYRKYKNKDGVEKYVTDIVAERLEFMSKKESQDATPANDSGEDFNIPF